MRRLSLALITPRPGNFSKGRSSILWECGHGKALANSFFPFLSNSYLIPLTSDVEVATLVGYKSKCWERQGGREKEISKRKRKNLAFPIEPYFTFKSLINISSRAKRFFSNRYVLLPRVPNRKDSQRIEALEYPIVDQYQQREFQNL